jgi:hypothetical protein
LQKELNTNIPKNTQFFILQFVKLRNKIENILTPALAPLKAYQKPPKLNVKKEQ